MNYILFKNLKQKDRSDAIKKIISDSTPDQDFFLLITLSILMATLGLLINSSAVIIGSMLIAPILSPILGLSLGIIMPDPKLISRSLNTIIKSIFLGVLGAIIVTFLFGSHYKETAEILARTSPSLAYFSVAFLAGLAASFALVMPKISPTLPGVAISVALIPPMAVIGIGLTKFNWELVSSSLSLFIINIGGIIFASMIIFSLMNLSAKKEIIGKVIKEEDKSSEEEKIVEAK